MSKKFVLLFVAANFILSSFFLDTWQNGNTTSRAIAVVSFAETRSLQIDKYHEKSVDKVFVNGHYYSDKAPLPLFIVIPAYELVNLLGIQPEHRERTAYIIGDVLCGSIPFTLIILISFLFIRNETDSIIPPVLLSTLPFYASFIFIYSGTFYGHLVSAFFLLLGYVFIRFRKKFLPAGIFCGLSFLSEIPVMLVIAIWVIHIFVNEKSIRPVLNFLVGIFPAIIFTGIYNYFITGNFFTMPYKYHAMEALHTDYGFSIPTIKSLWGLTFSPYRGLFLYTPLLLLLLLFFIKWISKKSVKEIFSFLIRNYLFIPVLASVIWISGYFEWWGGWCYGPRLIFFTAVLLLFECIRVFSKEVFYKPLFWLLIAFGFITTYMAKSTIVYSAPTENENPIKELVIPNFMNGNLNPNNFLSVFFEMQPKIANFIWLVTFMIFLAGLTFLYKKENAKQAIQ